MRDAGLEISKDLKERLRLLDLQKGGLVDVTSLETKLSKQAKSINQKKQKMATTAQKVVRALKKQFVQEKLSEDSFLKQANLVEQVSSGMASSADIMQEIVNLGDEASEGMKKYLRVQYKTAKLLN